MVPFIVALVAAGLGGAVFVVGRLRRRRPKAIAIDAFVLSEPWRRHVASAQGSQRRYREVVSAAADGPLRDRLRAIDEQVRRAVEECWDIAKRGDELDDALRRLDVPALSARLERATDEPTRASVSAQLASAGRIRTTRDDTDARLRLLTTRMGELVAQAAEVSVGTDTTDELGSAVDDVVTQLESLRLAVDDVNRTGRPSASP
jgi:hypothetical protein